MINRQIFFDRIRPSPFGGSISQEQVNGINAILDEWEKRKLTDLRWLAYMLATAYHETDHTMQPIREIGQGRGRKYGVQVNGHVYYGRGYVQLTWDYNYRKMGGLLGVDLLNNPEKALDPHIAANIMFVGMMQGSFTGKRLATYFTPTVSDWANARRIINGTDRAQLIAGYGIKFYAALKAAFVPGSGVPPTSPLTYAPVDKVNLPKPVAETTAVGAVLIGGGAAALQAQQSGHRPIVIVAIVVVAVVLAIAGAVAVNWFKNR